VSYSIETPIPPFGVGFGFAIERDLKLPNLGGSFYPLRASSRSFASPLRIRTSAPLRLAPATRHGIPCPAPRDPGYYGGFRLLRQPLPPSPKTSALGFRPEEGLSNTKRVKHGCSPLAHHFSCAVAKMSLEGLFYSQQYRFADFWPCVATLPALNSVPRPTLALPTPWPAVPIAPRSQRSPATNRCSRGFDR
jgi:hypothetical protein